MAERPILFSAPMVRALLAGQKTQTRRAVKFEGIERVTDRDEFLSRSPYPLSRDATPGTVYVGRQCGDVVGLPCPYGKPGDVLWVRETWQQIYERHDGQRFTEPRQGARYTRSWIEYAATADEPPPTWRPSIFMPKSACRIKLKITGIRIERLNEISPDDAAAEGWPGPDEQHSIRSSYPIAWYSHLWDTINGRGSWDANPWVWVLSFAVEKRDAAKAAA